VGRSAVYSVDNLPTFRRNVVAIFRVKNIPSRKSALLANRFRLLSCFAYSSTLKMEVTYSFEISVDFQRTASLYIPIDRTLQKQPTVFE
jgi:hypothetical protein